METGFISRLRQRLRRPYLIETSLAKRWQICLLYSGFVFLFLLVFRPFGLNELQNKVLAVCLGYGLTTFAVMALLLILLPLFLPAHFSEETWTVGREMAWTLVNIALIGFANLLYTNFIHAYSFSFASLLLIEGYTLAVGIFPVAISVLRKEARLKKNYEQRSEEINTALKEHPEPLLEQDPGLLTIPSENSRDDFSLHAHDLLYLRSSDNYIDVFYKDRQAVSRKVIRNSLKQVSEALAGRPRLFRCHKSYLVNLDKVSHVSGNAQGYKLHLPDIDILIPVSRQLNEEIRHRLAGTP